MEDTETTPKNNEGSESQEMTSFAGLYDIRDYTLDDKNFVLATFLRGVYYAEGSWYKQIDKDIFMDHYKIIAERTLDSGSAAIKIACLKEDPSVIIGYSILSSDYQAIIWVYVKKAWRLKGIGKSLVPKHPSAITHMTTLGKQLMAKFQTARFNPFYGAR